MPRNSEHGAPPPDPASSQATGESLQQQLPSRLSGPILAGVVPDQPVAVVQRAAEIAAALGVELVCAYVDVSSYASAESRRGDELRPIDPDGVYDDAGAAANGIRARLGRVLPPYNIGWSFRVLVGDPAAALGRAGESISASMIVVGTREPGFTHRLEELLTGSVATHLAHRQHRSVLVVPLNPRANEGQH